MDLVEVWKLEPGQLVQHMENDAKVAEITRQLELAKTGIREEEKAAQESENTALPTETTPPAAAG